MWCNLLNYCVVTVFLQWSVVDSSSVYLQSTVPSYFCHTVFWGAHQSQLQAALLQHRYCFAGWCSSGSDTGASTSSFQSFHGNTADRRTESRWYSSQVSQPEKVRTRFCFVVVLEEYYMHIFICIYITLYQYILYQEKSFKYLKSRWLNELLSQI